MTAQEEGWILCCGTDGEETVIATSGGGEHRCGCGRLLFRYTASGIELKCTRCKTVIPITIRCSSAADGTVSCVEAPSEAADRSVASKS